MLRVMTICFIYLATQNICLAFPKPQSTKLPMPEAFLKYDPKNALNVINLDVYQDSEDPNLYFYVPPFHIQQYKQGAASPFMNSLRIGHYAKADKMLEERDAHFKEYYEKIALDLREPTEIYK